MTDGTITTTVTFDELISDYDSELGDLREAYEEVVEFAQEEYGSEDAPAERPEWPAEVRQQAEAYEEAGKAIQKRQHVLETLREEYDDGEFTLKMLSGGELMEVETELRMEAQRRDTQPSMLQAFRQQLVVDRATVGAPDAVPTDDEGSPVPSECPGPLTLALHEQAERLNTSGAGDFRAPGFGDETSGGASGTSAAPKPASSASSSLDPTDESAPRRGDSS